MGLQSFSRAISLQTLMLLIYFFAQDPPLYLALDIQHHLPVQHLVLTRPQRLDKVKVPANRTLQALALYRLQHRCFLLVPSPQHLLLGQCQAAANLLCLGSSLVSLHLALGQLPIPVSCVMTHGIYTLSLVSGLFFFFYFETMCISYFLMF